ncbi:transposase domain-containing protein [Motilimonas sp. 1_MG-2023]|uniref:transposase domain-containing protein n=1 Tax=Motilimonas sp. 1_MG-2023 TaxID=3062672 RepID=UPI0026E15605|nr:transposase domain-containing protein [Motilimonas sp. 1_MG-2023]MDO6527650.1 transposase domain-containing protein [Motilimonas sp. 1_MG-2023]
MELRTLTSSPRGIMGRLQPYQYIHDLLSQLPYAETVEEIEALLPWNIRKNK